MAESNPGLCWCGRKGTSIINDQWYCIDHGVPPPPAANGAEEKFESMRTFWSKHSEWSQLQFGSDSDRGPLGSLNHLAKEVNEAISSPSDKEEYADLLLLTFDAARRSGMSYDDLLTEAWVKLAKNKNRVWGKPNADGSVEHVRSEKESLVPPTLQPGQRVLVEAVVSSVLIDSVTAYVGEGFGRELVYVDASSIHPFPHEVTHWMPLPPPPLATERRYVVRCWHEEFQSPGYKVVASSLVQSWMSRKPQPSANQNSRSDSTHLGFFWKTWCRNMSLLN